MQTLSKTRNEPGETPLRVNPDMVRVPRAPVELRINVNEGVLHRRIAELKAQLRSTPPQSLHKVLNISNILK